MTLEASGDKPLIEYSLDRRRMGSSSSSTGHGNKQHTYTCEQNARILLRLERERQLKRVMAASTGKLVIQWDRSEGGWGGHV